MAYKSDVVIQCVEGHYADELKSLFSTRLKEEVKTTSVSNSIMFEWKNICWNESGGNADIQSIMELLDEWHYSKIPYVFARVGENEDDVTYCDESQVNELFCVEDPCVIKRTICLASQID